MASLGKLVANIAHELNTPLGAINASISTLAASSEKTLELLPKILKEISEKDYILFTQLIEKAFANKEYYTTREIRKFKRQIKKQLNTHNIEETDYISDTLVDINVFDEIDKFLPLFKHKKQKLILETAYNVIMHHNIRLNIKTAIDRASKTILALKSYSRTSSIDEKVETDITKSINNVLIIYQNQLKKSINVATNYEEIPKIKCFPDSISQVWTNLIQNAIQAMDSKGELKIQIKKEQKFVKISFTDTGAGIPEDIRDKIFEPFFTTKPTGEGTGLGLDIIKKITEQHNGKINFESEIGKGTTFFVYLPY